MLSDHSAFKSVNLHFRRGWLSFKRMAKAAGSLSIQRIHTVFTLTDKIIKAFLSGVTSTIYSILNQEQQRIIESCTKKEACKKDKQTFKDLPTVVETTGCLVNGRTAIS